ncbi:MAG: hypothetical protein IIC67_09225 [Thaumarchaeota archaeon]|nr:hypothetical protein [Nitrososphaerota archaeon]
MEFYQSVFNHNFAVVDYSRSHRGEFDFFDKIGNLKSRACFEKIMETTELSRKSIEEIDSEREIENLRKVEAALFIAGRFLSLKELVTLTDVNPILLRKTLDDLSDKYKDFGVDIFI